MNEKNLCDLAWKTRKGGRHLNEREQQRNAVRNWQKQEAIRQQRQLRIFLIALGVIFLIWLVYSGFSSRPLQ